METEGARRRGTNTSQVNSVANASDNSSSPSFLPALNHQKINWKRILLLIIAITVHNIPGKLSVIDEIEVGINVLNNMSLNFEDSVDLLYSCTIALAGW